MDRPEEKEAGEMRIYISGPITGQKDYKETFALAADRIEEAGHEPVNPAAELQAGHRAIATI